MVHGLSRVWLLLSLLCTAELHLHLLAASPSLPELLEELLRSSEESLQQAALWIMVQLSVAGEKCELCISVILLS